MIKYLLDTNIAIYTIKNRPERVRKAFTKHYGQMAISTVTVMELMYGAERSARVERNIRDVEGFCARLDVLDYDAPAAIHSGQIRAALAGQGQPVGPYDVMIAGHARSRGLIVVTNNTKEFTRISGLQIENWV
ncbi:MAG TPA: VapC toxin family PIN domain ribonuclease [Gammaproteobacteria bacterium]|jgi:tRNA(fMet)-specific endonuclease VapC|nr:VapC toxin family PIN domain ribonuclease [Gammaproteobacteria bacterium]